MDETQGILNRKAYVEKPDFLLEDDWYDVEYEDSMLDLNSDIQYPEYTLCLSGAKCAPVTGLMVVSGQSGNGKTQTFVLLMAAYLGAEVEGIELIWQRPVRKILYVDTEMERGNTQLVVARVAQLCECQMQDLADRVAVLRLRDEEDHNMIWRKILKAIYEEKPDVVMLDGMLDIIGDFNDNKEAHKTIRKVMKLADHYNIPMWVVMHQNPGSTKMVGHEGSFIERKGTMVLYTSKMTDDESNRKYHFEVKNGKQRGEDIIPLKFHMEVFRLPDGNLNAYPVPGLLQAEIPATVEKIDPMTISRDDMRQFFILTIVDQNGMTTRDIREAVKNEYHIGATKADAFLTRAEKEQVIKRDETSKRYYLNDERAQQSEAPF